MAAVVEKQRDQLITPVPAGTTFRCYFKRESEKRRPEICKYLPQRRRRTWRQQTATIAALLLFTYTGRDGDIVPVDVTHVLIHPNL